MAYHESEEERKSAQAEDLKMRNAQRYARMLARLGESEDELAIYIEYAWTESDENLQDDLETMESSDEHSEGNLPYMETFPLIFSS